MKTCPKCKIEKELVNFGNNKNTKDGKQRICKECTKKEQISCYNKDKSKYSERTKKQINKCKDFVDNYKKQNICKKCNENRYWLLDFHHLDPLQKNNNIGTLRGAGSINKIKEEIKKCILLCKNCHSDFHYKEKTENIKIKEYLIGQIPNIG